MTPMASVSFGPTASQKTGRGLSDRRRAERARHEVTLQRKKERVAMLRALVDEWEGTGGGRREDLSRLKYRLRNAESQLAAMKI